MKTYTRTHSNKKALTNHVAKIRKRGGSVKSKIIAKGTKIVYAFGKVKSSQLDLF
ncbi:hypothetical protein Pedsa_0862 [Pseudopedobacter saltans DSM 12145]|uniref:Uncharacterized protein n=1 Tax=Pseudopedobacter saltans (strain ATCC 51119 / DSM 12145 / JCM 21818 / CCUG 39354 / LMG 10337 / NBRC 100064 / NCIMB 13643) TaxID=762903 RepID=F0S9S8_PSESL|nr:hypothetical protein [Pseudopedobacter saltans]ADY51434.1 hypothetical protein Pedsa_0862 [Pseudopedobacter saltans DSM 12145]